MVGLVTWVLGLCLPHQRKGWPKSSRDVRSCCKLISCSKENAKHVIGTAGTKAILSSLSAMDEKVATVAIGGINADNVQRVMFQSKATFKGLDGVAIVSTIMTAKDPRRTAKEMRMLIGNPPPSVIRNVTKTKRSVQELLQQIPDIVRKLGHTMPLCHNMTNFVVQNFAANVALSM